MGLNLYPDPNPKPSAGPLTLTLTLFYTILQLHAGGDLRQGQLVYAAGPGAFRALVSAVQSWGGYGLCWVSEAMATYASGPHPSAGHVHPTGPAPLAHPREQA